MAGGAQMRIQGSGPIEVAPDGTVRQEGQTLGRLEIVKFQDSGAIFKQGASYFRSLQTPMPAATAEVHQGKLESSNVTAAESAVRLVSVMRQFEMLQKAITIGTQMNRSSVQEVARVAS
jgi:flagellar basal body rod protein FlgG